MQLHLLELLSDNFPPEDFQILFLGDSTPWFSCRQDTFRKQSQHFKHPSLTFGLFLHGEVLEQGGHE